MQPNRRTALYDIHKACGARFVAFAGWDMPLSFSGISAEHTAVRIAAGLFDVSHMGQLLVRGQSATDLLEHVTVNQVSRLRTGQAQYSALVSPAGFLLDDILVYRLEADSYMLVVNAANTAKDCRWIESHNRSGASIEDASSRTALLALQGPKAQAVLESVTGLNVSTMRYYHFAQGSVSGVKGILSRTGYTGEDGFEFYFPRESSALVWRGLIDAGSGHGLIPAGLGARNTLRLEAGMLLYGNDIDETTTPLEAGLDRICKLEKGDFLGRTALVKQKRDGIRRRLVGFQMLSSSIARDGYAILVNGKQAGQVTSGGPSITLRKNIGLAYLPVEYGTPGTLIQVRVRQRPWDARVVPTPFYERRYRK